MSDAFKVVAAVVLCAVAAAACVVSAKVIVGTVLSTPVIKCETACDCGPFNDCCECKPEDLLAPVSFDDSECRFSFGQKVEITKGFYCGYQGPVARHKDGIYQIAIHCHRDDPPSEFPVLAVGQSYYPAWRMKLDRPEFVTGIPESALKSIQPTEETK